MSQFPCIDSDRAFLEAYAWPGGYQLLYIAKEGYRNDAGVLEVNPHDHTEAIICPTCAKDTAKWPDVIITGGDVHWEGPPEQCEYCNEDIPSAYGDPTEDK